MLRKLLGPKHTFKDALVILEKGLRSGEITLNDERRTDVTYAQLDKVLHSLGFSCRLVMLEVPARVYEHEQYGPLFTLPPFPESDRVLDYHLVAVRTMLDANGIADPATFAAELQKAR